MIFWTFVLLSACADDSTRYEMQVKDQIPIDFQELLPELQQVSELSLESLENESRYVELIGHMECAGLNTASSFFEVSEIDGPSQATVLDFRVELPNENGLFQPFLSFYGSAALHERVFLRDARVLVNALSRARLSQVLLSEEPVLNYRFSIKSSDSLTSLGIELTLVYDFSSDPKGCEDDPN